MVWSWLERKRNRWRDRKLGSEAALTTNFVPHAEWSLWLAEGQWDRAAVLLEELRAEPRDGTVKLLIPEWERRLAEAFLAAGWADLNTTSALRWLRRVDRFPDRGLKDPRLETFREAADRLWDLERACAAGDFREAAAHLERARHLFSEAGQDISALEKLKERIAEDHELLLQYSVAMRILEDDGRHEEALKVSRRILAIASRHKGALSLAKRLGHIVPAGHRGDRGMLATEIPGENVEAEARKVVAETVEAVHLEKSKSQQHREIGQLSIDRAHTWLVTPAERLAISPAEDSRFADLFGPGSEAHVLSLQRDSEGCWLFACDNGAFLDGKPARNGCLNHGAKLRLGENGIEFRFFQPRPETGTARIERPDRGSAKGVKGILLLGELIQIGGTEAEVPHSEIVEPLLLARTKDGWKARRKKAWSLEGHEIAGDSPLKPPCRMRVDSVGIFWEC